MITHQTVHNEGSQLIQSTEIRKLTLQACAGTLPHIYKRCNKISTCLSCLNSSLWADVPCIASDTMVFAKDLDDPGLPTRNSGIRSSMHTTIINTFSFRAWLRAILSSSLTLSSKMSWHLWLLYSEIWAFHVHLSDTELDWNVCFSSTFIKPKANGQITHSKDKTKNHNTNKTQSRTLTRGLSITEVTRG